MQFSHRAKLMNTIHNESKQLDPFSFEQAFANTVRFEEFFYCCRQKRYMHASNIGQYIIVYFTR